MLTRWQSAFGSVAVSVVAIVLVVLDLTVDGVRTWWDAHSFTTCVVSGLVVLAFTVLVSNQVITLRQIRARSTAIAAQAALVMAQAARSAQAIKNVRDTDAETEVAAGEVQSYVLILSVATPVLIGTDLSRRFLEDSQALAVALGRALRDLAGGDAPADRRTDDTTFVEQAVRRLRESSAPLVEALSPDLRAVLTAGDDASG